MTLSKLRDGLSGLPRRWKQAILIGFDTLALLGVLWLSFTIRLGGTFTPTDAHLLLMLLAPLLAVPVFVRLGLYRAVIRYLPERALWTIIQAMMLATLLWVFALFLAEATRLAIFPRTVPLFYFIFGTVVVAGSRFLAKALLWLPERQVGRGGGVVIYGAGSAGTQLAEALRAHRASYVVAFLDDDRNLWGRDVAGIRVDPPGKLGELIRNRGVSEVILSIPSADATRRAQIVAELSHHPIKIRALPAITDLVSGKYLISQLREIDIDDLLGRSAVPADPGLMREILADRAILVTGAGGSIGSYCSRPTSSLSMRSTATCGPGPTWRSFRFSARSPMRRWCVAPSASRVSRWSFTPRRTSTCHWSRPIRSRACATTSSAPACWWRRQSPPALPASC